MTSTRGKVSLRPAATARGCVLHSCCFILLRRFGLKRSQPNHSQTSLVCPGVTPFRLWSKTTGCRELTTRGAIPHPFWLGGCFWVEPTTSREAGYGRLRVGPWLKLSLSSSVFFSSPYEAFPSESAKGYSPPGRGVGGPEGCERSFSRACVPGASR